MLNVGHLHNFAPKPRAKVQPHLTSFVSGNHFLSPADFATIYDLDLLYSAGSDGSGQKIAVVGQSTVSTTDLNNFRAAAGLPASTVTMTLQGGTGTKCVGDEGESDLDIEWAGGVAKKATIIFVYAGLNSGDACGSARANSVWDALDYAVQHDIRVVRIPGMSAPPVAEFTFALLLSLARKVNLADRLLREGHWPKPQLGGTLLQRHPQ